MFHKLESLLKRHEELTTMMADPELYQRQKEFRSVSEERAGLERVVQTYKEYKQLKKEFEGAKEILELESDDEMRGLAKEEVDEKAQQIAQMEHELRVLLIPKDPCDNKNVMVEIRAGAGGDEASIFVGDLYRMYQNFLKVRNFKTEVVSVSKNDEGIKEIIFNVTGEGAYSLLKYESGVHRVQRVPKTEAQGRIHTSTVTVAVLPEADEIEFELDMNEIRIDVYRAGGHGGQSVNTTDSAVRVTHLPTATVVAIQDEKSQLKNKDKALKILRNRLYDQKVRAAQAKEALERKEQVGTGDRSERIRTYNYPQGRVSDHRIGLTLYNLEKIMVGEMEEITDALTVYYQEQMLKGNQEE